MSLKDFDWKQFFIEKGEKVGLGITVFLMVVMTIVSLFMPNHGFFVPSAATNAEALTKVADGIKSRQATSQPGEADKPPAVTAVPVSFRNDRIDDPKIFEVATRFLPPPISSTKRRVPELFQPDEGTAVVALAQIRSYIFDKSYSNITVFKTGGGTTAASTASVAGGNQQQGGVPGAYGRLGASRGGFGGGGPIGNPGVGLGTTRPPGAPPGQTPGIGAPGSFRQSRQYGQPAKPDGIGVADKGTELLPTANMTEADLARAVEQVRPQRMAIVYATFPYKKQVEEFQRKLRLDSPGAVIEEKSEEEKNGVALPAFRFLGVDVQRREVRSDGQPDAWQTLDLTGPLRQIIIDNGMRFEDDPEKLKPLIIPGLWMRLLKQFDKENRFNRYPEVETQLANVQKTLEELKGKDPEDIVKPKPELTTRPDFDPFAGAESQSAAPTPTRPASGPPEANAPGMAPPVTGVPGGSFKPGQLGANRPRPGRNNPGIPTPTAERAAPAATGAVLPDHVLVRVVDVTIEPGKVYEYRLHVRMANPNYKRNADVLSPSYAIATELGQDKERKDSDWFVVPTKVSVPPEFRYYVVDQKEIDGKAYRGIHAKDTVLRDQQAVFQIQRWLEEAEPSDGNRVPVGEWAVAERVPVWRGEYIGRTEKVDVPIWRGPSSKFILAVPPGKQSRVSGINVPFSLPNDDAVLVDFEGGPQQYERKVRRDDKVEPVKVRDDNVSNEVLLVTSDGRVTARNSAYDAEDQERKKRLDDWRMRILELKLPSAVPSGPGSPFGPVNPGGGGGPRPGGRPGAGGVGGIG